MQNVSDNLLLRSIAYKTVSLSYCSISKTLKIIDKKQNKNYKLLKVHTSQVSHVLLQSFIYKQYKMFRYNPKTKNLKTSQTAELRYNHYLF